MRKKWRHLFAPVLLLILLVAGCGAVPEGEAVSKEQAVQVEQGSSEEQGASEEQVVSLEESGEYTSRDEVAAYLHEFAHLPDNFITKEEARELGWVSKEGNLGEVAPGKSIGGDHFGNYEGQLPKEKGRKYYECDIDSDGGYRGAKRIIYSNDGLIYYAEDHYETFELLYGEE